MDMQSFFMIGGGIGFIFLMTCLGAATVFLFRKKDSSGTGSVFLGFAAGVMIAAAVWGLLVPAIEEAQAAGHIPWIPAAGGFILGVLFLLGLDNLIPHIHPVENIREGMRSTSKRTTLLISAVTLHNIPEGMAIGLAFALAAQQGGDAALYASAVALAIGIGIQNFPEGAAIAHVLRQEGFSKVKSFFYACLTGVVEPLFGVVAVLIAAWIAPAMPWLLSFAAGAMIYVVVEELIPEAHLGSHSHSGSLSVVAGFLVMMVLDITIG
ncbi:MAG: ZIP family metal transporter [Oscillospiraceae bacterium]|nr:ZIP family metal transporter [Oscillospiraceae bacterium]